jgi:hypothetical protein
MRRSDRGPEKGYVLVLVAISMFLLLGVAAFAIDLAAIRLDRAADQKVTDTASAAGALDLAISNGQDACETALAYVALNTPGLLPLNTSGCATFAGACNPFVATEYSQVSGRFTVNFVYPVPNGHALMTSGLLGASSQAVDPDDNLACERVGVAMTAVHEGTFSRVLGISEGPTTVHTVATAKLSGGAVPINLLVLDRSGCQSIQANGNGGVIVKAVINPDGGGPGVATLVPGIVAADSDGSAGCTNQGVIDIDGSGSLLRADGPAGCSNQTGTAIVGPSGLLEGFGCGLVMTFAPGTPGCGPNGANTPACTPGANGANRPNPEPTALPARLTRAPVDHRYNCQANYSSLSPSLGWATAALTVANEQNIPGCVTAPAPHIHDLITSVGKTGAPVGFNRWTSAGYSCNLPASSPPIVVNGNWWIDCATFTVKASVTINGSVVFNRNVTITGSGHINVQNTLSNPGYAFFRNGTLSKAGGSSLTFNHTMVYLSRTSRISMTGGTGSITWVAPDLDGYMFDDLALWSDSPSTSDWAGQAGLRLEGVFFTPLATADYSGTSGQNQTDAQWIADRLVVRGSGFLVVQPAFGRAVEFPQAPRTTLIR